MFAFITFISKTLSNASAAFEPASSGYYPMMYELTNRNSTHNSYRSTHEKIWIVTMCNLEFLLSMRKFWIRKQKQGKIHWTNVYLFKSQQIQRFKFGRVKAGGGFLSRKTWHMCVACCSFSYTRVVSRLRLPTFTSMRWFARVCSQAWVSYNLRPRGVVFSDVYDGIRGLEGTCQP